MAWSVKVTRVSIDGGNAVVEADFSNGDQKFSDKIFGDNLTLEYLKNWAAARIASLTSRDETVSALKSLEGADLSPEERQRDSEELIAFRVAWATWIAWQRLKPEVEENAAKLKDAKAAIEEVLIQHPEFINDSLLVR